MSFDEEHVITYEFDTDDREIDIPCILPRDFSTSHNETLKNRRCDMKGIMLCILAGLFGAAFVMAMIIGNTPIAIANAILFVGATAIAQVEKQPVGKC